MRSAYPSCLVDTNVLLYQYDPAQVSKGRRALEVVRALSQGRRGLVSAQILGEFFVGLRRLEPRLSHDHIVRRVRYYVAHWHVCAVDSDTVMEAIRGTLEHQFAYYDGLIWATAKCNHVPIVLSEDCHDGRIIEGVLFRNPLADGFDLAGLLRDQ